MTTPFERVIDELARRDLLATDGRLIGRAEVMALCPSHDDRDPSLSVREGDDGRCLLWCFAGCETPSVIEALGLEWSDLFEHDDVVDLRYRAQSNGKPADPPAAAVLGEIPKYPTAALPVGARSLVSCGVEAGLPAALLGGAALAAMATALGPGAQIEVTPMWHERAILWIPLVAPRGVGKSPAQDLAFGPLRDHDAQLEEDDDGEIRFGDLTLEALARSLHDAQGAGVLDLDELAVLLRGFGEYKRRGGGDRGRFLALWSGAPWSFRRVGGGDKKNKVKLRISRPTLIICGGLQPALHELLGGEEDGLRPRWLPHLAGSSHDVGELRRGHRPNDWQLLLGTHLLPKRHDQRTWRLDDDGLDAFQEHRTRWKKAARGFESATTSAALVKADVHLARVALVLAEASAPGRGGTVGRNVVERAAKIIDFSMACWRALPEQGGLALSRADWHLNRATDRLVAWLEECGGSASRREIQRAGVAGVRRAADLDALLAHYEATYPGTVTEEQQEGGGLPTKVVRAPMRTSTLPVSDSSDTVVRSDENPHPNAEKGDVGPSDTVHPTPPSRGCAVHPVPRSGCRYCRGGTE
jgi:hypothetical protein